MFRVFCVVSGTAYLQVSDKHSGRNSTAAAGRAPQMSGNSASSVTGRGDHPLFAGNMQGGLSNKYAGEPHLKDPLDPRYASHGVKIAHIPSCCAGRFERQVIVVHPKLDGNNIGLPRVR